MELMKSGSACMYGRDVPVHSGERSLSERKTQYVSSSSDITISSEIRQISPARPPYSGLADRASSSPVGLGSSSQSVRPRFRSAIVLFCWNTPNCILLWDFEPASAPTRPLEPGTERPFGPGPAGRRFPPPFGPGLSLYRIRLPVLISRRIIPSKYSELYTPLRPGAGLWHGFPTGSSQGRRSNASGASEPARPVVRTERPTGPVSRRSAKG